MGALAKLEEREIAPAGMEQAVAIIRDMANSIRALSAEVSELRAEVHRLKPATPAQVRALNSAIHERAGAVCAAHRVQGGERKTAAAIRKALKLQFGISSVKELPRTDYAAAVKCIGMWDDWKVMRGIRDGLRKEAEA